MNSLEEALSIGHMEGVEHFLFDTMQMKAGVPVPENANEWGEATRAPASCQLFGAPSWNCQLSNSEEPNKLPAPERLEIRETRISFSPAPVEEIERFCYRRVVHVRIGQKKYGVYPLAILAKPLEIIRHVKLSQWIAFQRYGVVLTGPEFTPSVDFDLVIGFFGSLYRGVS